MEPSDTWGYDRTGSDIRAALCIGKGRAISV